MIYLKNVRFEPLILKIIKNHIIIELSLESCKEWSMQLFLPLGQNKNQVKQIFDKKNSNITCGCTNKWNFFPFFGELNALFIYYLLDKIFSQINFEESHLILKNHLCILLNNSLV